MNDHDDSRQVLVNFEINDECPLTSTCGPACALNQQLWSLRTSTPLCEEEIMLAAAEIMSNGAHVRHLALSGKEPVATPDRLMAIVAMYHATSAELRPGAIGFITSGFGLRNITNALVQMPVTWCGVSIDVESTGLHKPEHNTQMLRDLLAVRQAGGTSKALVNTVFTSGHIDDVIELGHSICRSGIDQWGINPFLAPHDGRLQVTVSPEEKRELVKRVVTELGDTDCQIMIELELDELHPFTGRPAPDRWRDEYQFPDTNVWLIAPNFDQAYFVRLLYNNGLLVTKDEFLRLGLQASTFGRYQPGRIAAVLGNFARVSDFANVGT